MTSHSVLVQELVRQGDAWRMIILEVNSYGRLAQVMWPNSQPPHGVAIEEGLMVTDGVESGEFLIHGLTPEGLGTMDEGFAQLFRDNGLVGAATPAATDHSYDGGNPDHAHPTLVDEDDLRRQGAKLDPHVNAPKTGYERPLLDDDAGGQMEEIQTIDPHWGEPPPNYCDSIERIQIDVENWLTLGMAGRDLTLHLTSGQQWVMKFGAMDLDGRAPATRYRKSNGIIWPADDSWSSVVNGYNCPKLVQAHEYLTAIRNRAVHDRITAGTLAVAFGQLIGASISALDGSPTVPKDFFDQLLKDSN